MLYVEEEFTKNVSEKRNFNIVIIQSKHCSSCHSAGSLSFKLVVSSAKI